ncbi:T9SS type A sorting domain-containing protein, partial [Arthrospira platensis SPKY1]|nr:T9SS type A sorting domain-containing protein [Arthrospira platensis SPKY1]
KMYPNPTNGIVNITSNANMTKEVSVFNMLGKEVLRVNVETQLNVSGLNKGVYMVQVKENNQTATLKLVIN